MTAVDPFLEFKLQTLEQARESLASLSATRVKAVNNLNGLDAAILRNQEFITKLIKDIEDDQD